MPRRLLILSLLLSSWLMASAQFQHDHNSLAATTSITGVVVNSQGKPVGNARVELHSTGNGLAEASAYTSGNGSFELRNVENGNYDLVVTSGINEDRQRVSLDGATVTVNVTLRTGEDSDGGATVSVGQLKVPSKARSEAKKAREELSAGKFDDALRHIDKALSICPLYAEPFALRGIVKLQNNDVTGAAQDLQQAIDLDPNFALSYLVLGSVFNVQEHYDDAIRTLESGLRLAAASWQGYFELGKALLGKGNYEDSLKQLTRAESLAPQNYTLVHLVKAHAYLGLKRYSDAVTELETYLSRDPKGTYSESARQTLGKVRAFAASGGK